MFRARSDMVDFHGKRALNFQISMTIYTLIAVIFIVCPYRDSVPHCFWHHLNRMDDRCGRAGKSWRSSRVHPVN